ncbi:TetR/AcrR family transcriptional regulator [Staphylococcus edaphicus]|uniref:Biofilm operon icaADBC HTH-type negative transcriptional regulator IcaR n=1 Tax=Staphylococcus edaphicus TaxID=1955013 RepID=A0A2C6U4E9_9STAP|nr:TetR/AcrR family transcriptional regulator [Staphylococcus edaphicus]PHK48752.1 TetR family transcriptional regulator [Staphylococcus edaphicus]UQW81676.1 TetR/AcrR family transcriptional regulator [Staphylococcus edaphicus]
MKLGVKEKIVENAISLFSENGYEGTTLNQIANSVDIKKASLYYHYASKEEIYRSCVNACINYFTTFIEETKKNSLYSIEDLQTFLYDFIFNIDEKYIRLYLQLSYAPYQFKDEFLKQIKYVHQSLDSYIAEYYKNITFKVTQDEFTSIILMFLESWYLKCCFIHRYGILQSSKSSFSNELSSLLNIIYLSK